MPLSLGNHKRLFYTALLLSGLVYLYLGYFFERSHFNELIFSYSLLFALYLLIVKQCKALDIRFVLFSAIALRLLFIVSEPALSDDVYRFIWDGRLWSAGINPFSQLPEYFINSNIHIAGLDQSLYDKLNSPGYFTIYPPFNQFLFYLSTVFNVDNMWISIILIRLYIIGAEIGSLLMIGQILKVIGKDQNRINWYAFNPLIILELSGNLHFEAWLIFFLLTTFYFLLVKRSIFSSLFFALAIATKLWPLMFLPLLFGKMKSSELLYYYLRTAAFTVLLFIPVLNLDLIANLFTSVDLYFRNFEFNASLFYLARFIGLRILSYDPIQTIGPLFALITAVLILILAWWHRKQAIFKLPESILLAFSIYLGFATTVHPWYITVLIAFGIFTELKYVFLWSYLVILSYFAYSNPDWNESLFLIAIEYLSVFIYMIWELRFNLKRNESLAQ
jgi:alpha-1,6-mannosyltransferase